MIKDAISLGAVRNTSYPSDTFFLYKAPEAYRHPVHAFKLLANLLLGRCRMRRLRAWQQRALHSLLNIGGSLCMMATLSPISFHQICVFASYTLIVGPFYDVSKEASIPPKWEG